MKTSKTIQKVVSIIFVVVITSFTAKAQLNVVSSGNVGIGTTNPLSKLSVNGDGNALWAAYIYNSSAVNSSYGLRVINATPSAAHTNYLFTSIAGTISPGNGGSVGVLGRSFSGTAYSSGRSYGVYGMAGNATSGYNYSVYGLLSGSNNGAAIYGCVDGASNDDDTGGKYAGYFKGTVYMDGYLGIGNKYPSYELDVEGGTVYAATFLESSDERLKDSIVDMTNSLNKLTQLRGVSYKLKMPETKKLVSSSQNQNAGDTTNYTANSTSKNSAIYSKVHMGFLAQEIQKIYPELVYENKEGMLAVNYIGLIPAVVEALKEQEAIITEQNTKISALESSLASLNEEIQKSTGSVVSVSAKLYQNSPNPFNTSTEIQYYLPEEVQEGTIYIFNMQGTLISSKKADTHGKSSITINASELNAGMYIYSLVIDGKEIDSKRMILTD